MDPAGPWWASYPATAAGARLAPLACLTGLPGLATTSFTFLLLCSGADMVQNEVQSQVHVVWSTILYIYRYIRARLGPVKKW